MIRRHIIGSVITLLLVVAPVVASACVTCSVSEVCTSKGCHTVVTCTYQPGPCEN
jgi:hypothetical protein